MELLIKFYNINHSHYHLLVPLTKRTVKTLANEECQPMVTDKNIKLKDEANQSSSNKMIKHPWKGGLRLTSFSDPKKFLILCFNIAIHVNSICLTQNGNAKPL